MDDSGIIRTGTYVKPGEILVGKVSPKSKTELTPEEKLLHAIFGRAGEDVKNDSLEVSSGIEGIVIDTQRFSRRISLSDEERKVFEKDLASAEEDGNQEITRVFGEMVAEIEKVVGKTLTDEDETPLVKDQDPKFVAEKAQYFRIKQFTEGMRSDDRIKQVKKIHATHWPIVEAAIEARDRQVNSMKRGDEPVSYTHLTLPTIYSV